MSGRKPVIPDPGTRQRQADASDPGRSAWVSANAGSGKTYVLALRVIRLLLSGCQPSQLLCLTFTRAAAAEMSNRVFSMLSGWTICSEERLKEEIANVTGAQPGPGEMTRARQLFALALDTPGGLKIQTIHSFCEALLRQFPLEANLPAHFDILQDSRQAEMMAAARQKVELAAAGLDGADRDVALTNAMETAVMLAGRNATARALDGIIAGRFRFAGAIGRDREAIGEAFAPLWPMFGLNPQETRQRMVERHAENARQDRAWLPALAEVLSTNTGKTAPVFINRVNAYAEADAPGRLARAAEELFATGGKPRKQIISEKFEAAHPEVFAAYRSAQARFFTEREELAGRDILSGSEAIATLGQAVIAEYSRMKRERGLLDFDDMIDQAVLLLHREDIAPWVQYKLDQGISHVLVDEAQDTSPRQWAVINAITSEFFAGEGARENLRTLFVVGDEKQSIYSFQGAAPAEFAVQRRRLKERSEDARLAFSPVELTLSFRSTSEVLSAVDRVFSIAENRRGLSGDGEAPAHTAYRGDEPGEVTLWPLVIKEKREEPDNWFDPVDLPGQAEQKLARRIARTIRDWLEAGRQLPGMDRPLRPGDFLILVRKRDRFVHAMNQELRDASLPSAGADRLQLAEHIASEDLLAITRFAIAEADDLSLAGLLKSPLFSFSEAELFTIAHGRGKETLWSAMQRLAGTGLKEVLQTGVDIDREAFGSKLASAIETLKSIRQQAHRRSVFDFLAWLIGTFDLRSRYHHRLGREAEDILDGFMEAAANHDSTLMPGLRGFVEWMETSGPELKREVDMNSDEIRVITVHSAKGLEAPVVFLVDPGSAAFHHAHLPELLPFDNGAQIDVPLWSKAGAIAPPPVEAAKTAFGLAQEEEYRRLLYVGMTRAKDHLIICGYAGEKVNHEHWHSMVEKALVLPSAEAEGAASEGGRLEDVLDGEGGIVERRWTVDRGGIGRPHPVAGDGRDLPDSETSRKGEPAADGLPSWIAPAPGERRAPRPLSPSGVGGLFGVSEEVLPVSGAGAEAGNGEALTRGTAIHALLQILPGLDETRCLQAAQLYFRGPGRRVPPEMHETLLAEAQAVLAHREVAGLFAEQSRAEVSLTGTLEIGGEPVTVLGKVDRLADDGKTVILADYKTGSFIPGDPAGIPDRYLVQLGLYRALLARALPGREIRTLLIWTAGPVVQEIPASVLDARIAELKQQGARPRALLDEAARRS